MDLLVLMVKGSFLVALVTFFFLEILAILMQFGMWAYRKQKYRSRKVIDYNSAVRLGYHTTIRIEFEDFMQNMWICLIYASIPAATVWLDIYIYTFYFL